MFLGHESSKTTERPTPSGSKLGRTGLIRWWLVRGAREFRLQRSDISKRHIGCMDFHIGFLASEESS